MRRTLARAVTLAVVAALVAAVAVVVWGDRSGPGQDQARLRVAGSATVTAAGGASEVVTGSRIVDFGSVVTIDEGTARLELAAGQVYELRSGIRTSDGITAESSRVRVESPPTLLAGDVLISSGFPAAIRYDTTTESAAGALKVHAGVPLAAAYEGRTTINGAQPLSEVTGLRQVVITPSAVPEPLHYDAADPWDRRYLGAAIAFGNRLEALARGYTSDLRAGDHSADFFRSVLPGLAHEREFGAELIDDRAPGETLVGAAIATQGREGTFRERWQEIFAFRDQGAAWGLVAADQGVSSAPVLESIELAIGESPLTNRPPPPTTTTPTTAPPPTSAPTSTPPPTSGPTTTTPPPTTPPPPPGGDVLDPVLTPTQQILDDVLGVLGLG